LTPGESVCEGGCTPLIEHQLRPHVHQRSLGESNGIYRSSSRTILVRLASVPVIRQSMDGSADSARPLSTTVVRQSSTGRLTQSAPIHPCHAHNKQPSFSIKGSLPTSSGSHNAFSQSSNPSLSCSNLTHVQKRKRVQR
jgi:hypothetical protein